MRMPKSTALAQWAARCTRSNRRMRETACGCTSVWAVTTQLSVGPVEPLRHPLTG